MQAKSCSISIQPRTKVGTSAAIESHFLIHVGNGWDEMLLVGLGWLAAEAVRMIHKI
jgi:hypothetical protein